MTKDTTGGEATTGKRPPDREPPADREPPLYRERPVSGPAARHLPVMWVHRTPSGRAPAEPALVTPDACVDLLWTPGGLSVAGPDTAPRHAAVAPGNGIAAVRLRPGAARVLLGDVPSSAVTDTQPRLEDLWPAADVERLAEHLAAAPGPWEAASLLADALARRVPGFVPDAAVLVAVRALDRARPPSVAALADQLGLSERQLRRRVVAAVGYGPKALESVLRYRRAVAAARTARHTDGWARVAAEVGYADQAHLSREMRRLSGGPPGRLARWPERSRHPSAAA